MRDFFLAGRRLPWYAVSASIIATEISAVTYISVPSVVYRDGGNLTYLQLGLIGSLLARLIVGYFLVPVYYRREIYSPYDYVGERLGESARRITTALFALGGVLAQAARVYLTAVVLEVILQRELAAFEGATGIPPLTAAIAAIGVVAVLWTWMGGIATVVWTDAVLFGLFIVGLGVSLATLSSTLEAGLSGAFADGWRAGKFQLFDFDADPARAYTFWVALLAAPWSGVASYGVDQLMAQRMFCCRSPADARRAIITSIAAMGVTLGVALVGIGLWAYYSAYPLGGAALDLVASNIDRIFPVFIVEVVPAGLKGLVLAGAFAAAISSLDSILAALSQTTLSAVYLPWRQRRGGEPSSELEERRTLRISRGLVALWGVLLCAGAIALEPVARHFASILDLALAMASYTGGALLGALLMALLPQRRDASGLAWSAPLSVLAVFAISWHQPAAQRVVAVALCLAAVVWIWRRVVRHGRASLGASLWLLALLAGIALISRHGFAPGPPMLDGQGTYRVLAWPWWIPCGALVALSFGILLRSPRPADARLEPRRADA